jgi:hypothetical protein
MDCGKCAGGRPNQDDRQDSETCSGTPFLARRRASSRLVPSQRRMTRQGITKSNTPATRHGSSRVSRILRDFELSQRHVKGPFSLYKGSKLKVSWTSLVPLHGQISPISILFHFKKLET